MGRLAGVFETLCWFAVLVGLFFSLLASQGCADDPQPWRPRDYCAAVADSYCSHCPGRLAKYDLCWERMYRGCQRQVEGLVDACEAEACLDAIDSQWCGDYTVPSECPDWAD